KNKTRYDYFRASPSVARRIGRKERKGRTEEIGISFANAQRHKGDGPAPVIPNEHEGSKKDFS
ncbi:MAG: hypothetical protein ACXW50_25530, partial [Candidatus Binatia bacterium]